MAPLSHIPRIVVAGLRGGSGKTTLSIGLISALGRRGVAVRAFKKGPDYIDAGWLASASKGPCYNLDPFLVGEEKLLSSFVSRCIAGPSSVAVIEGNRGLYDGMDSEGTYSTGRLSKILKAPVILIVDCTKATRTVAAMVLGAKRFDPSVKIKAVVLNNVAGARHEDIIREAIERYVKIPVIGAIPRMRGASFPERHMGLTPYQEHPEVGEQIERTAGLIEKHVDLDAVIKIAGEAPPLGAKSRKTEAGVLAPAGVSAPVSYRVRIGVIRDSAFQFYYPENFEELIKKGAEIVEVSALTDRGLPEIDALYIGGGFPETHAIALARNARFKKALLKAVEGGLPVYAECGGLMYLGETLKVGDKSYPMAGALPVSFSLESKPEAHGYTIAEVTGENPFYKKGTVLRGHEFHYSRPVGLRLKGGSSLSFGMKRGRGIKDGRDGLTRKNVFATYTHLHALGSPEWTEGMIRAALEFKKSRP